MEIALRAPFPTDMVFQLASGPLREARLDLVNFVGVNSQDASVRLSRLRNTNLLGAKLWAVETSDIESAKMRGRIRPCQERG
jgi:uncharacterized protein YjbI with pentapeptide repeats